MISELRGIKRMRDNIKYLIKWKRINIFINSNSQIYQLLLYKKTHIEELKVIFP